MDDFDKMMDDEFDFDFDNQTTDTKSRNPVENVLNSTKTAMKNLKSPEAIARNLSKVVDDITPVHVNNRVGALKDIKRGVTDKLGNSVLNVRREGSSLLGTISSQLPKDSAIKGVVDRLKQAVHVEGRTGSTPESMDSIASKQAEGVFGSEKFDAQNSVTERLNLYKSLSDTEISTRLLAEATVANEFNASVTNKYYRKSLELQFKGVLIANRHFELAKATTDLRNKQFESITRNTALPDFVKTRGSEYFAFLAKEKASKKALGMLTGNSYVKQITETITDKLSAGLDGLSQTIGLGSTIADARSMALEMGENPLIATMEAIISGKANQLGGYLGKKALGKLLENKEFRDKVGDLQKVTSDPKEAIRTLIDELDGKDDFKSRMFRGVLEEAYNSLDRGSVSSMSFDDGGPDARAEFDNKTKTSIVTVIPSFLSKIYTELKMMRTGKTGLDEMVYDHTNNRFTTRTLKGNSYIEEIRKTTSHLNESIGDGVFSVLDVNKELGESKRKAVKQALIKHLMAGGSKSPYYLIDTGFLGHLPGNLKKSVRASIEEVTSDRSTKNMTNIEDFGADMDILARSIDSSLSNFEKVINKAKAAGDSTIIEDIGLFKDNDRTIDGSAIEEMVNRYSSGDTGFTRGFDLGGFTGWSKNPKDLAGVVHKNEFVLDPKRLNRYVDVTKKMLPDDKNITIENVADKALEALEKTKQYFTKDNLDKNIDKVKNADYSINGAKDGYDKASTKAGELKTGLFKKVDKMIDVAIDKIVSTDTVQNVLSGEDLDLMGKTKMSSKNMVGVKIANLLNSKPDFGSMEFKQSVGKTNNPLSPMNLPNQSLLKNLGDLVGDDSSISKTLERFTKQRENIEEQVNATGLNATMKELLKGHPLPTEKSARSFYTSVFNIIDPTGEAKKKWPNENEWLVTMYKLHIEAITDVTAENTFALNIDPENDNMVKRLLRTILPKEVYGFLKDNKVFGAIARKMGGRVKDFGMGMGKVGLDNLGIIRDTWKERMYDHNGELDLGPRSIGNFLARSSYRVTGNTIMGTSKNVKNLYGGLAKDTLAIGKGLLKGQTGFQDAPISNELKEKLRLGLLAPRDVHKHLDTKEMKDNWAIWFRAYKKKLVAERKIAKVRRQQLKIDIKESAKEAKDGASEILGKTGDLARDKINEAKEKNKKDPYLTRLKNLFKPKNRNAAKGENADVFDVDGDGDRDGNWSDRLDMFKNLKNKGKDKKTEPTGDKKKKDKGLLSTLMMFGGFLIAKLSKFLSGGFLKGVGTLLGSMVGGPLKLIKGALSGIGGKLLKLTGLSKIPKLLTGLGDKFKTGFSSIGKNAVKLLGLGTAGNYIKNLFSDDESGNNKKSKGKSEKSFYRKMVDKVKRVVNPGGPKKSFFTRAKDLFTNGYTGKDRDKLLKKAGNATKQVNASSASKDLVKAIEKKNYAKLAGKYVFSVGKKIPLLSLVLGGGEALYHATNGDWDRAGVALAAGAVATVPVIGTAAAIGLDIGGQAYIDKKEASEKKLFKSVFTNIHSKKPAYVGESVAIGPDGKPINPSSNTKTKSFDIENRGVKNNGSVPKSKTSLPKAQGDLYDPEGGEQVMSLGGNAWLNGLHPEFKTLFYGMAKEFYDKTGIKLQVNSAYRSIAYQAKLKRAHPGKSVATPGRSMHNFGLAVDIETRHAKKLIALGLVRKYGFTFPVGDETWHMEPAKCQLDVAMSRNDPEYAGHMCRLSPGLGGPGWGYEKGVRHYSRNKQFQIDEMKAGTSIIAEGKQDSKVFDKNTLAVMNGKPPKIESMKHTVNRDMPLLEKIGHARTVKQRNIENKKHIDILESGKSNSRNVTKSLEKGSIETVKVLEESLSVQKSMLAVLKSIDGKVSVQSGSGFPVTEKGSPNKALNDHNFKPPVGVSL